MDDSSGWFGQPQPAPNPAPQPPLTAQPAAPDAGQLPPYERAAPTFVPPTAMQPTAMPQGVHTPVVTVLPGPPRGASWGGPPTGGRPPLRPLSMLGASSVVLAGLYTLTAWGVAATSTGAHRAVVEASDVALAPTGTAFVVHSALTVCGALVALVALLVTGFWLRAGQLDARALGAPLRLGTAWAWWSWVVPVVLLWFPKQIVDDVWRGSQWLPRRPAARSTALWWGLWLGSRLAQASAQACWTAANGALVGPHPDIARGMASVGSLLDVVAALTLTGALVAWVWIVREISAAYDNG